MMHEMKRKQEEQKIREIEEKKAKDAEAKRKRLEEAEKKRQAMLDAMQKQNENSNVKPNFVINRKEGVPALGALGRAEVIKSKEQLAEEKKIALGTITIILNILTCLSLPSDLLILLVL
jgi:troponin T